MASLQCLLTVLCALGVYGFDFTSSAATQCDDLTVSWRGGQQPFRLLIIPPGGTIRNISIPSMSFANGVGTFSTQLQLAQNRKFALSMSDATGLVAGGTSSLLTVGPSLTHVSCNLTEPNVDFYFSLESDLKQCKPYPFTLYPNATQPITIIASVLGEQSFVLHPPEGDSYNWTANVDGGASMIFTMFDSLGRAGGTSDVKFVLRSGDASCLSQNVPSVTPTLVPQPKKLSSGAIAAIVVSVLVFSASLPVAALLLIRRAHLTSSDSGASSSHQVIDLTGGHSMPGSTPLTADMAHTVTPYNLATRHLHQMHMPPPTIPSLSSAPMSMASRHLPKMSTRQDHGTTVSLIVTEREFPSRSNTANTRQSRVYVHSDIEETPQEAVTDDVVELPPQYSARRQPLLTSQLVQATHAGGLSNLIRSPSGDEQ